MDSENANKSKKKKTSNIIQICIGVLAVMLAGRLRPAVLAALKA